MRSSHNGTGTSVTQISRLPFIIHIPQEAFTLRRNRKYGDASCVGANGITFAVPMKRLEKMIGYMDESFLATDTWSVIRKMKNKISSPYRKLRLLLILPVFALVLYAFARPEYRVAAGSSEPPPSGMVITPQDNIVKGVVVRDDGTPLRGSRGCPGYHCRNSD